ncbi:MAG: rhodanese-like domain-containing protein [Burkholderiaceae bacterium]|jgi:rhodanese-related sulfurtransferase|nr:rhodanese-like domain-containing protein [Burkholderiaceae bacterium]
MFGQPITQDRRAGLLALALLAAWASNCALAQQKLATPQGQVQEQDLSCLRDEGNHTPHAVDFKEVPFEPYTAAERACWIDWDGARRLAAQGAQWVDVREAGTVQRLRLVGALPVPSHEVAGKAALRGLNLLIVGEDTDLRALSRQCLAWKSNGNFNAVHVVLGGVRAWRLARQPVQLDTRAAGTPEPPEVVTPAQFWQGQADRLWRVVTLGVERGQAQILGYPVALALPKADAAALQELQKALAQTQKQNGSGAPAPSWLAVAADAPTQARLLAVWGQQPQAATTPALLWLGGGVRVWREYLSEQKQLAAHAGHALPRACGL